MSKNILAIKSISQLHAMLELDQPDHPLVSVIRHDDYVINETTEESRYSLDLFAITLKNGIKGSFLYGRNTYDYEEGTLIFTSPGQVLTTGQKEYTEEANGWSLYFHPDLLRHSALGNNIDRYHFFAYSLFEALHLSGKEKSILNNTIEVIQHECAQNIDKHSQHLIVTNIQLLLDYCVRFYDRQFYTRTNLNKDILSKFEQLLRAYYYSEKPTELGLPTVKYCSEELNLSANYLSDLLKTETGKSARDHIHSFVIEKAKNSLLNSNEAISQIGYNLGFEHPSHFNKLFKAKTGMPPSKYRLLN